MEKQLPVSPKPAGNWEGGWKRGVGKRERSLVTLHSTIPTIPGIFWGDSCSAVFRQNQQVLPKQVIDPMAQQVLRFGAGRSSRGKRADFSRNSLDGGAVRAGGAEMRNPSPVTQP